MNAKGGVRMRHHGVSNSWKDCLPWVAQFTVYELRYMNVGGKYGEGKPWLWKNTASERARRHCQDGEDTKEESRSRECDL